MKLINNQLTNQKIMKLLNNQLTNQMNKLITN